MFEVRVGVSGVVVRIGSPKSEVQVETPESVIRTSGRLGPWSIGRVLRVVVQVGTWYGLLVGS